MSADVHAAIRLKQLHQWERSSITVPLLEMVSTRIACSAGGCIPILSLFDQNVRVKLRNVPGFSRIAFTSERYWSNWGNGALIWLWLDADGLTAFILVFSWYLRISEVSENRIWLYGSRAIRRIGYVIPADQIPRMRIDIRIEEKTSYRINIRITNTQYALKYAY
jgi:hypothetical protein